MTFCSDLISPAGRGLLPIIHLFYIPIQIHDFLSLFFILMFLLFLHFECFGPHTSNKNQMSLYSFYSGEIYS